MASTWGTNTWGANTWQSDEVTVAITSPGTISALGTPQSFNVEGWGRQQWSNSGWGVEYSVEPSGVSITSSQGTAEGAPTTIVELTGLSSNVDATFPTVDNITPVTLTGFGITSSLGSVVSSNEEGWGRAEWNNGALIYNSSQSDKAVCAIAFGSDKTVTSGTFTIQFPTADATNAIIRLA